MKEIEKNQVLCLWLYDKIDKTRVVITTFPNGSIKRNIFNSKDAYYFSPIGPFTIEVKQ